MYVCVCWCVSVCEQSERYCKATLLMCWRPSPRRGFIPPGGWQSKGVLPHTRLSELHRSDQPHSRLRIVIYRRATSGLLGLHGLFMTSWLSEHVSVCAWIYVCLCLLVCICVRAERALLQSNAAHVLAAVTPSWLHPARGLAIQRRSTTHAVV